MLEHSITQSLEAALYRAAPSRESAVDKPMPVWMSAVRMLEQRALQPLSRRGSTDTVLHRCSESAVDKPMPV
jgi:hypothetical protein